MPREYTGNLVDRTSLRSLPASEASTHSFPATAGAREASNNTDQRLQASAPASSQSAKVKPINDGLHDSNSNLAVDMPASDGRGESEPHLQETGKDYESQSPYHREGPSVRGKASKSMIPGLFWDLWKKAGSAEVVRLTGNVDSPEGRKGSSSRVGSGVKRSLLSPLSIALPSSTASSPAPSFLQAISPWPSLHADFPSPKWLPPIFSPVLPILDGFPSGVRSRGIIAAVSYTVSSCSMILVNKLVLSSYHWEAHVTLMLYQNALAAAIVLTLRWGGIIPSEPIPWRLIRLWLPVNIIFVGMLVTSFFSLQFLQVAMATILKNCTNVLTALGESYLSNMRHELQVWLALMLMILSAIFAGYTDISFHPVGYSWQALNCVLTAAYVLTLRQVMKSARQVMPNGAPVGEFTMVLLNSTLSLPLGAILAVGFGEVKYVLASPLLRVPSFWTAATLSGLLGLAISFSSMWCLHMTSPTTFSLIGSFNKVPLAILGIVLFHAPTSTSNLSSICVGLLGGMLFAWTKVRQTQKARGGS